MICVFLDEKLIPFETDIRDLCLAFFPYKKILYFYKNEENKYFDKDKNFYDFELNEIIFNEKNEKLNRKTVNNKNNLKEIINEEKIIVKDFYNGKFEGLRIDIKSELKRQLYNYLKKITNKNLLWGTLTGIRPVNIVTELIEKNNIEFKNVNELKSILKKEYFLDEDKADKLIEIALNEINILSKENIKNYKNENSVYVGVPFCKSTCLYCSFTSFNVEKYEPFVKKYLDVLEKEFIEKKENLTPLTLYIGGGTPTSLDYNSFDRLLNIVDKYVDKKNLIEYTVEAGRADTIDEKKLEIMKKYGVSRISINPQTFNEKTLKLIGRKHTAKDVIEKYYLARKLGFDNINMDIILGLPDEKLKDVKRTLRIIKKLKPDSLTIHSLALKRAARLNFELNSWINNHYLAGLDEKITFNFLSKKMREIDKMFFYGEKEVKFMKMKPYYLYRQKNIAGNLENIGYAKENKECVYNIMMMSERHTVYGFGLATTKKVFYENGNKKIESMEGYKSIVDYCK